MSIDILARQIERARGRGARLRTMDDNCADGYAKSQLFILHFPFSYGARRRRSVRERWTDRSIDRDSRLQTKEARCRVRQLRPSNPFVPDTRCFRHQSFSTASFSFDQAFCVLTNIRDALLANGEERV